MSTYDWERSNGVWDHKVCYCPKGLFLKQNLHNWGYTEQAAAEEAHNILRQMIFPFTLFMSHLSDSKDYITHRDTAIVRLS